MSIHETIKAGIPEALKARDEVRLRTLRSLTTAMTNEVVAKKRKPDEFLVDEEALVVLKRASNQRKDSIDQFEKAGRDELAIGEKEELAVIEAFLPTMMSKEEVVKAVKAKQEELGITDKTKMGMLMSSVMKDLKGQAEGAHVKEAVDALFA